MKKFQDSIKSTTFKFFMAVLVAANIFTICSVSTASLSDVRLCASVNSSSECDGEKSTFTEDAPVIYCSAKVKNAPSNTKVSFSWKFENESLGTADVETSSGVVFSTYKSPGTLKTGKYSVTVKINTDNSEPVTKNFSVE